MENSLEDVVIKFRVRRPVQDQIVWIKSGENVIMKQIKPVMIPSEMVMIKISKDKLVGVKEDIVVSLEDR